VSDHERDEIQSKLRRLTVSERYINGEKEARQEAKDLLKRIGDIDLSEMSPRRRMLYEIEKQIGNES